MLSCAVYSAGVDAGGGAAFACEESGGSCEGDDGCGGVVSDGAVDGGFRALGGD